MACRTAAKTSLVHRFTQVLLNHAGEEKVLSEHAPGRSCLASPNNLRSRRMKLEKDVERLEERLEKEQDLHIALENAIAHAAGSFPSFPRHLPVDAQELLAEIAVLEVAISSLEEQLIGLKLQIRHERMQSAALHKSAKPHKNRLQCEGSGSVSSIDGNGYREMTCDREGSDNCAMTRSSFGYGTSSTDDLRLESDIIKSLGDLRVSDASTAPSDEDCVNAIPSTSVCESDRERMHCQATSTSNQSENARLSNSTPNDKPQLNKLHSVESKSLWKQPNKLSEEMVACMIGIYCHLSDPTEGSSRSVVTEKVQSPNSPFGQVMSSSSSSISELSSMSFAKISPFDLRSKEEIGAEGNFDPYATHNKLPWADIGTYNNAIEVSWMSVGKEQLEYAADALRVFRSLVEQLSKVDVVSMEHHEKLAFWINVYNALMMHAYLAYGVPKNDVKYFNLIQKAAYTVGGHFFNAMTIEHVLLRNKAPSHRPQIALLLALHKVKIPEGISEFAISKPETLVIFALSSGAYSSPAVRIYKPETMETQLKAALQDYVRATIGVTAGGKVLVPKLLHSYYYNNHTNNNNGGQDMVSWLSSFLPQTQAAVIKDSVRQQQRRRVASTGGQPKVFSVVPFDLRLRYLFLVDEKPSLPTSL